MKKTIIFILAFLLYSSKSLLSQNQQALVSYENGLELPCNGIFANSANNTDFNTIVSKNYSKNFIKIRTGIEYFTGDFFRKYKSNFGIHNDVTFQLIDEWQNVPKNATFFKYQQYYKGIKVENAFVIEDFVNCLDYYLHGFVVNNFSTPSQINYDSIAITNILFTNYDVITTSALRFELVYYGTCLPVLSYKVYVKKDNITKNYYFNVANGELLKEESNIRAAGAPTIDYGTKDISDSKDGDNFILFDESRKILTENILSASQQFPSETNGAFFQINPLARQHITTLTRPSNMTDWVERPGHLLDDQATFQAHYSAGKVWDYYNETYGLKGPCNGDNTALYVGANLNVANAFGTKGDSKTVQGHISLGFKNGISYSKHDFVAHEWGHTLISATSDFKNSALEESFCDIMGVCAKKSIGDPNNGADLEFGTGTNTIRNLYNPSEYYGLDHFSQSTSGKTDYQIGGIQGKWFGLLILGGTHHGVTVYPIGWAKAEQIAFDNMKNKLSGSVDFADARAGSILAAMQIYGECSFEVQQVTNAWAAVGVGQRYDENGIIIKGNTLKCKENPGGWGFDVCGPFTTHNYIWYYPQQWTVQISGPLNNHFNILSMGISNNPYTETLPICVRAPWYDRNGNGKQDPSELEVYECIDVLFKDCDGQNPGPCEKNGVPFFGSNIIFESRVSEEESALKLIKNNVYFYPSIVENSLYIVNNSLETMENIYIINPQGIEVNQKDSIMAFETKSIDVTNLDSGLYIVQYSLNNKVYYKKIIKQ